MHKPNITHSIATMALAAMLAAPMALPATAQPMQAQTTISVNVSPTTAADTAGIEAFSDTSAVDTAYVATPVPMSMDVTVGDMNDMMGHLFDSVGSFLAVSLGLLALLLLLPLIIIGALLYIIYKNNRRQRTAGAYAPSPQSAAAATPAAGHAPTAAPHDKERDVWSQGVMNAAVGLGLVLLFWILDMSLLMGLACLLMCYGAGQMVVAKTTHQRKQPRQDSMASDDDDHVETPLGDGQ